PQVLGAGIRRLGEFSASEDAGQEGLIPAGPPRPPAGVAEKPRRCRIQQCPTEGLPENPRGWLIQVAVRRMTDHLRAESARRRRENQVALETGDAAPVPDDNFTLGFGVAAAREAQEDDTLILLFMCCHPALTRGSAIAL